jgi:hypothetical protein
MKRVRVFKSKHTGRRGRLEAGGQQEVVGKKIESSPRFYRQ